MMCASIFRFLFTLCVLTATPSLAASQPPSLYTATLYHAPLSTSTPAPQQLAVLRYDVTRRQSSVIEQLSPPSNTTTASGDFELTQIINYLPNAAPKSSQWRSSTTAIAGFYAPYQGRFRLLVTKEGEVLAASYRSWLPQDGADTLKKESWKGEFDVVVQSDAPVVVFDQPKGASQGSGGSAGAAEGEGEEPVQKTFLQKYWWLLIGVAVIVMTGGGADK